MTNLFILVLIVATFVSCENPIGESKSIQTDGLSQYVVDNYFENVYHIYANKIIPDTTHRQWQNPVFDVDTLQRMLSDINSVYTSDNAHKDSVFGDMPVVSFKAYSDFQSISFFSQKTNPEYQALSNKRLPDTEPFTKSILEKYGFINVKVHESKFDSDYLFGNIESDKRYFIPAIMKEITVKSGFGSGYVEGNWTIGDGDRIFWSTPEPNVSILAFQRRWGDCPAGCINSKSWAFKITPESVEFIGEFGNHQGNNNPLPKQFRY